MSLSFALDHLFDGVAELRGIIVRLQVDVQDHLRRELERQEAKT